MVKTLNITDFDVYRRSRRYGVQGGDGIELYSVATQITGPQQEEPNNFVGVSNILFLFSELRKYAHMSEILIIFSTYRHFTVYLI